MWGLGLDIRTLIVILVLIEWLQTKPCRPHWLHKPGIMVSLWGGKVIRGLEEYQTQSYGLWEGVSLNSVLKLAPELKSKLPAALAKRCKTEVLLSSWLVPASESRFGTTLITYTHSSIWWWLKPLTHAPAQTLPVASRSGYGDIKGDDY